MITKPNPLSEHPEPGQGALQRRLEIIIFGTGTPSGRRFDMTLIAAILLSVAVVVLDSVPELDGYSVPAFGMRNFASRACLPSSTSHASGVRTIDRPMS